MFLDSQRSALAFLFTQKIHANIVWGARKISDNSGENILRKIPPPASFNVEKVAEVSTCGKLNF